MNILLAALVLTAVRQPSPRPVPSLDSLALGATHIVVGKVIDYAKVAANGEQIRLTVQVEQTCKGDSVSLLQVDSPYSMKDTAALKVHQAQILVFAPGPLNGERPPLYFIDDPKLSFWRADFTLVSGRQAILEQIDAVLKSHPDGAVPNVYLRPPRNYDWVNPYRRSVEWSRSAGDLNYRLLIVPRDRFLEDLAYRCAKSSDTFTRAWGVQTIGNFKSDANIAFCKQFFNDPAQVRDDGGALREGDITYLYLVREEAMGDLDTWHVPYDHSIPWYRLVPDVAGTREITWSGRHWEDHLSRLSVFKNLRTLRIEQAWFNPGDLEALGALKPLRTLSIHPANRIDDSSIDFVCRLTNLEHLDIPDSRLTDAGLQKLAALKHLKTLNLDGAPATSRGVARLSALLPNLKVHKA